MTAVDTSVVVAAFASWHEAHDQAVSAIRGDAVLPAHAAVETYSVLTRLPEPHRAHPALIAEYLRRQFPARLAMRSARQRRLVADLERLGISGGACYDAAIALTCADANEVLVTLNVRAAETYRRCGVEIQLLHAR